MAAKRASTKRPKITVTFDDGITPCVDRKLYRLTTEMYATLDALGDQAAGIARSLAPVRTGNYKGAIVSHRNMVGRRVGVDTMSRSPHATLVESGRKPGKMPPVAAIAAAFNISLREAYPIARSIGRKKTKPARVMSKTRARMRAPTLEAHIAFARWVADLDAP